MGTFIILPAVQLSGGTPIQNADDPVLVTFTYLMSDYPTRNLLQAIRDTTDIPSFLSVDNFDAGHVIDTIRFQFTGDCIYLDGSLTPISFAGLPAGFTPLTASVKIATPFNISNSNYYLQKGAGIDGVANTNTFDYSPVPSMLIIVSNGCGLKLDTNAPPVDTASVYNLYNLRVEGTYEATSFSWDLEQPDERVNTGNRITITSDPTNPLALNFKLILTISILYTDSNGDPQEIPVTIINKQDTNILIFTMPNLLSIDPDNPPGIAIVSITSTEFSGSMELGKLVTIYFLNAPGIYSLDFTKTSDTLYDIENGGTVDVKIPNPRFETGFVGD